MINQYTSEQKIKIKEMIEKMTNKELFKFNEKTDKQVVPYLFQSEYKNYLNAANPDYGYGSKILYNNIKDLKKEDFIIITIFNSDIEKEDLTKKKIQFVPFDKIFVQTSIPFVDAKEDFCVIDSIILIKDKKENVIHAHCIIKYVKEFERKVIISNKFYENELNLPISMNESNYYNCNYPELNKNQTEITSFLISNKIRKLVRYLSYKLITHQYKNYCKYEQGKLVEKEIVYSSEVKSHKRHFWKDSGKFIIPNLSKEEILEKGYFIDGLVFKNNELRQNIPYTIIGNFQRNKDKEKKNREINLFKKKIWKTEEKIYLLLKEIYPDKIIRRHDRKTLNGLELDFNIPELRLGIEYDGEQHFDKQLYKKLYGDGFDAQIKRDRKKNSLCGKKGIKLIRIKYDESITKTHIKNKIKDINKW